MSRTRVYRIWAGMLARCRDKSNLHYGGRKNPGPVTVAQRWKSFANFYADMGEPPTNKHELDRIDWRGNYTPKNTRWATGKEQARNRSNVRLIDMPVGKVLIGEASILLGKKPNTVQRRRMNGFGTQKALLADAHVRKKMARKYSAPQLNAKTVKELARLAGVNYGTTLNRIQRGIPLEEALKPERSNSSELADAARANGIAYLTARARLKAGWSFADAVSLLTNRKAA